MDHENELYIDPFVLTNALCELGGVDHLPALGVRGPLPASAGAESLFHCLFGRDAIRMASDLLDDFPNVAHSTLLALASLQGVHSNSRSEEEPGRMLHEHRQSDDPHAARLGKDWDWPYYGAVDTTPQWIDLLAAYSARYGKELLEEPLKDRLGRKIRLRDSLLAAVQWIVRRLDDPAGAGYLWVRRASPTGNRSQVWEDSSNAFHYSDGTLFDSMEPFAPVAVQGYVYDALLGAATLLDDNDGQLSPQYSVDKLRSRARRLRALVLANFWLPDHGTFAHAITIRPDGSTKPVPVIASAPGHLLASGMLDGADTVPMVEGLVARLLQPDLLAAAGIRTKSSADPLFAAGAYHNGAVWPMDTGVIADGLRRHGRVAQADELETRILRACAAVGCFPEFFRGELDGIICMNTESLTYSRNGRVHYREQQPQYKQGWTITRVWSIVRRRGVSLLASHQHPRTPVKRQPSC